MSDISGADDIRARILKLTATLCSTSQARLVLTLLNVTARREQTFKNPDQDLHL